MCPFKPLKSPGPDGIKPIVLQHLTSNYIERLSLIYKACIRVGYLPKSWCTSEVIFIPKPSKESYDLANSFRPISLSSFYMKRLEKMVHWELERTSLAVDPLHTKQHAFRKVKCTDTVLYQRASLGVNTVWVSFWTFREPLTT
jgi:hypothetical protein